MGNIIVQIHGKILALFFHPEIDDIYRLLDHFLKNKTFMGQFQLVRFYF